MSEKKKHGAGQRRAIQRALGQLGWQATGRQVVALLASHGIDVSEDLVSRVKIESLKQSDRIKQHEARVKTSDKRRNRPMTQKKPPRRA